MPISGKLLPALLSCALLSLPLSLHAGHGLAMHGDLKYPKGFEHFDYVNPDAPKGGAVRRWALGTFDSFNGNIIKGTPGDGLPLLYDSLMAKAYDEPFSLYGLLASDIEMPESREWVRFSLNPKAQFSDGEPVLADDVVFTFNTLLEKGNPFFKSYLGDIDRVEATGEREVTFHFKATGNQEIPLIVGEIPILPAHYWQDRDFTAPSLDIPIGSGPYLLDSFEPGRSITYRRNPNYWGADLAVNKGRYNFDKLRYDYYRDTTVSLEAFKAGEYDFRQETSSKNWATAYRGPQFDSGEILRQAIDHGNPTGMQAFIYNTRREIFSDPRVRQALAASFDFEWTNKNIFHSAYKRTHSYFSNSDMAAGELPSEAELEILEPLRDQLPEEVFTQVYQAPTYDEKWTVRKGLRQALKLLKEAGWQLQDGKLVNQQSGEPMKFEILLVQKDFERVIARMKHNLSRLGVEVTLRVVDVTQYLNRLKSFDFDMIVGSFPQSSSPGNEQFSFWHSSSAEQPGSRNFIGVANPAIDKLIEQLVIAKDREQLVLHTKALDRALQWNYYTIPQFHAGNYRIAYRNMFGFPATRPSYSLGFDTWWVKPEFQADSEQNIAAAKPKAADEKAE